MDPDSLRRMVPVTSCASRIEAQLKRTALEDAGIEARVLSDDAGGLHPEMAVAYCGAHRLVVPDDRRDEAISFLDELDRGEHALGGPEDDAGRGGPGATVHRMWFRLAMAMVALLVAYRLYRLLVLVS